MPTRDYHLEVDGWRAGLKFSAAHIIPRHEKCSRLHGHTYAVSVRVRGPAGSRPVVDLAALRSLVRNVVVPLHHRVILPRRSSDLTVRVHGRAVTFELEGRSYRIPKATAAILDIRASTAEELSRHLLAQLAPELPRSGIAELEVGVDEGIGQGAWSRRSFSGRRR